MVCVYQLTWYNIPQHLNVYHKFCLYSGIYIRSWSKWLMFIMVICFLRGDNQNIILRSVPYKGLKWNHQNIDLCVQTENCSYDDTFHVVLHWATSFQNMHPLSAEQWNKLGREILTCRENYNQSSCWYCYWCTINWKCYCFNRPFWHAYHMHYTEIMLQRRVIVGKKQCIKRV